MTPDRPTPLTDAWQAAYNSKDGVKAPTILEFMKQLERQNAELREALGYLSNEVLGSLPLLEEQARRDMGNTNYTLLIQRATEARAAIARKQP